MRHVILPVDHLAEHIVVQEHGRRDRRRVFVEDAQTTNLVDDVAVTTRVQRHHFLDAQLIIVSHVIRRKVQQIEHLLHEFLRDAF